MLGLTSALASAAGGARPTAGGNYAPAVRLTPPTPATPPGSYRPGSLFVALYGHPGSRTLGALGEQSPDAAVRRIRRVADLQSGRARFPDQARELESLLVNPHVSLALDPEWRVTSGRPGGGRIGTVDASEVNETFRSSTRSSALANCHRRC